MEQWKQLDYLETKNKRIWRNLEYHIRRHEGEILLGLPRNALDMKNWNGLSMQRKTKVKRN